MVDLASSGVNLSQALPLIRMAPSSLRKAASSAFCGVCRRQKTKKIYAGTKQFHLPPAFVVILELTDGFRPLVNLVVVLVVQDNFVFDNRRFRTLNRNFLNLRFQIIVGVVQVVDDGIGA